MNINDEFDTITAISTPIGAGGVGVIRISGSNAFNIIKKIFSNSEFTPRTFNYGWIFDGTEKIDEVIVLPFFEPNSYTGEDVIEIQCHGGINVVNNILNLVLKNGARLAENGEFTKRAFLNKKMDLSQAEAVADLIDSKTSKFAKLSVKNLTGSLKFKINELRDKLVEILSAITAAIDFPEDVREPEYDYIEKVILELIKTIDSILSCSKSSNILRQGISVVIAGKPNVGKSSLFNLLLNYKRAIVTDIAGTTRDVLKETLDLGVPVTLIDTAGIRKEGSNEVEDIGIEYSKQSVENADFVLFVYDINQGLQKEDIEILNLIKDKQYIKIANKTDLLNEKTDVDSDTVLLSVFNKNGFENLKTLITEKVCHINPDSLEYITNIRQQNCLIKAKNALEQALIGTQSNIMQDMIAIDIKSALLCFNELTGELVTDEILDNIFKHFCIGK